MTTSISTLELDDFFEQLDERIPFESLQLEADKSHGIKLDGLYCLHTGKLIGHFCLDELTFAIDEESDSDLESMVDSLAVRVVASMRPSPALNKPDMHTIKQLVSNRPVDALAYLVNRLYGNQFLLTKRSEDSFAPLFGRIKAHQKLTAASHAGVDLTPWIHWLLELDSKVNLHTLTPPTFERSRKGNLIATKTGESLMDLWGIESNADLYSVFCDWVFSRLDDVNQLEIEAKAQAAWSRSSNAMTKTAYVASWLENPQFARRKEAAIHNKKARAAQGRPKSAKSLKKQAQVDAANQLLAELMGGSKVVFKPRTESKPARKLLSAGALFAKKEV